MTSKAPWQAQIRAALVLLVGLWMLVLGLPGFDTLRTNELQDPEERARAFADYPDPAVHLALGLIWWNREVRLPVVAAIEGSQRPFRLAQTWALYRNGPSKVRHLEVWIDDEVVYRTQHPELNWREDKLRSRRIRPMVESTCMGRRSKNWRGLARWISTMAREDFPETRRVELRCKAGPFPGTKGEQLSHFVEVEAPHWKPRMPK